MTGDRSCLSPREFDVIRLVVDGLNNAEIADRLRLSRRTVQIRVANAMSRTQTRSRTQLAVFALRRRIVPLGPRKRSAAVTRYFGQLTTARRSGIDTLCDLTEQQFTWGDRGRVVRLRGTASSRRQVTGHAVGAARKPRVSAGRSGSSRTVRMPRARSWTKSLPSGFPHGPAYVAPMLRAHRSESLCGRWSDSAVECAWKRDSEATTLREDALLEPEAAPGGGQSRGAGWVGRVPAVELPEAISDAEPRVRGHQIKGERNDA